MNKQTWVIKIGSGLITNNGVGVDKTAINSWVKQIVELKKQNINVILVSSGAIAEGMIRLNWEKRPTDITKLQAAAAVGQMGLVQHYESSFAKYYLHTAQVLLTHNDIKKKSENISTTLMTLLNLDTIPIINENDTVATSEIKFGDNDTLAAEICVLVNANRLVILTDQQGLYNKDPRQNNDATLIKNISVNNELLTIYAEKTKGELGSGGMFTKIVAAQIAAKSKTNTFIVYGKEENVLPRLLADEKIGTIIQS